MKNFIFCAVKIQLLRLCNIASTNPSAFLFSVLTLGLKALRPIGLLSEKHPSQHLLAQSQQSKHQSNV